LFPEPTLFQVAKAKETEAKIDVELKDLQATLSNIQDARPFEDLTVRSLSFYSSFPLPRADLTDLLANV